MASSKKPKEQQEKKSSKKPTNSITKTPTKKPLTTINKSNKASTANGETNKPKEDNEDVVFLGVASSSNNCDESSSTDGGSSSCEEDDPKVAFLGERSRVKESGSKIKDAQIKKGSDGSSKKKKVRDIDEDVDDYGDGLASFRFPMARIKRIMKTEDSDLQLSQDVVFLVNKATEKFIEHFAEEAYKSCVRDRKKSLAYKHLSSVVAKQKGFDFLSDYVPEKVKAEDALAQRKTAKTIQG